MLLEPSPDDFDDAALPCAGALGLRLVIAKVHARWSAFAPASVH